MSDNDNLPPEATVSTTASDIGLVYPPRDARDILAYDPDEMLAAFIDFDISKPEPGANRSPAYRWAWRTRTRDCQLLDDGFDYIRLEAARLRKLSSSG